MFPQPMLARPSGWRWWPCVLVALVLNFATNSDAGAQIVGRGREAEVLRLLDPYADGKSVTPQVRLVGVRIGHDHVAIQLAEEPTPTGKRGELRLLPAAKPTAGSFAVQTTAPTAALRAAADAVAAAVQSHDDGKFFDRGGKQVVPTPTALPAWMAPSVAALWALVALAVLSLALRHGRRLAAWLAAALVLVVAARARQQVPFTPLHADDHAWLDAAVGLGDPDVAGAALRQLTSYGPSWVLLQRWTAPLFGSDLEALGRWSTAVGALAAVFSALAAARLTGKLRHGWLPGLLVAWLPVAVRVGRSESAVVLAQLLLACAVLLAPGRRLLEQLGAAAAILLLTTGHPLGPVFAGAGVLAVWGLRRPEDDGDGAGHSPAPLEQPALPAPEPRSAGPKRRRIDLATTFLPPLVWLAGAAWLYGQQPALVGERLQATDRALPLPSNPWLFWLWWRADYGSSAALVLAFVGPLRWPRTSKWRRLWLFGALSAGAVAGWLVIACLTDALRYQAPLAPLLAVGLATWGISSNPDAPDQRAWWQAPAMLLLLWQLIGQPVGLRIDDAQAQSWRHLRRELADATGAVQFVVPERKDDGGSHVVLDAPRGLLWAGGPTATVRQTGDFAQDCRDGVAQPPTWLYLSSTCAVRPASGVPGPCRELEALIDHTQPVRSAIVRPLPRLGDDSLRGEFHDYLSESVDFRLARAKCP